jgi:hypothetical protein
MIFKEGGFPARVISPQYGFPGISLPLFYAPKAFYGGI